MPKIKKNSIIFLEVAFFLAFTMLFFSLLPKEAFMTVYADPFSATIVILDAGHGGEDSGTVGVSGVLEKDLNLVITEKLGEYLANAGFAVVYTRSEDKLLYKEEENIKGYKKIYDLKNRSQIANSYADAIFVSIHMNWYSQSDCKGAEIYYADDAESKALGASVRRSIVEKIQPTNNRSLKVGKGIYLLEHSTNPAILIECGFLSNANECEKLSQKEYQKELCFSIVCGIIEYNNNKMNGS
jgi:N-acetylmuramoyl-L-alanine amidase